MSGPAIRVEGLSKRYLLRHAQARRYTALRDVAAQRVRSLGRFLCGSASAAADKGVLSAREVFWALRDVSFEVRQGERLGIIGRNGAGKSTLLKILSRITVPTTGRIELAGRVASLLEVGTGFHPELTGRENVSLNGAILGMSRKEIRGKFDEIVAFAEVEKFLDTPVKRYSSGMYVRLAFAVAAHLDTEILLVDEVLAVGDAEFQKKCLGKMDEVGTSGRTVLFVSHNMAAIQNLCSRALLLQAGHVVRSGVTDEVVEEYLSNCSRVAAGQGEAAGFHRPAWARPLITAAGLFDPKGRPITSIPLGGEVIVELSFDTGGSDPLRDPVMGVVVHHAKRGVVGGVNTRMTGCDHAGGPFRSGRFRCLLKELPLLQGPYFLDLWLGDGAEDLDTVTGCLRMEIEATDLYGTGRPPFESMGVVHFKPSWELIPT